MFNSVLNHILTDWAIKKFSAGKSYWTTLESVSPKMTPMWSGHCDDAYLAASPRNSNSVDYVDMMFRQHCTVIKRFSREFVKSDSDRFCEIEKSRSDVCTTFTGVLSSAGIIRMD